MPHKFTDIDKPIRVVAEVHNRNDNFENVGRFYKKKSLFELF